MEVSLAVLADYANVSQEGKLNIMGVFNTAHIATPFPASLPQCFLVLRLLGRIDEKGTTHRLRFRLHGPDGKHLTELSFDLEVPSGGPPGEPEIDLILSAAPLLVFEQEGPHELTVDIDDVRQRIIKVGVTRSSAFGG